MVTLKVVRNTIHTVKIIMYKFENGERKFLTILEPENIYGFVGGAQDTEDKDLHETAVREIKEEISLSPISYTLSETPVTHKFLHTDIASPRYNKIGILHAFTAEYNKNEAIILCKELLKYEWLLPEEVTKRLTDSYPYLTDVFQKVVDLIE